MAQGLKAEQRVINFRTIKRGRILDPVTAPANTGFHRVGGTFPISITVGGTAGTITWQVYVTNAMDSPTSANLSPWGSQMSGKGSVEITVPYEFIYVDLSAVSGGNAFVDVWAG